MSNTIIFDDDARLWILKGIEIINNAVKLTMWPKGRNVIIETWWTPLAINDGVTVARNIIIDDSLQNLWATIVKDACEKTNKEAGDGTTTTAMLTYAICKEWIKYIKNWINPFVLTKALHKVSDVLIEQLCKSSIQITTNEQIKSIATLSSQDEEVGQLIADIIAWIGNDWIITVEETKQIWLTKEIKEGMQFDSGYISPLFVNEYNKMEVIINNPAIIVTDKKISKFNDIYNILEKIWKSGKKDIVIIAEDIDWEALWNLILNKLKNGLNIVAIKLPSFWDNKKEIMNDITIVTGATLISDTMATQLDTMTLGNLWYAEKIIVTKDNTIIINGQWDDKELQDRLQLLRIQLENKELSEYQTKQLKERLAKLIWNIGIIKIGTNSQIETTNKKYKIEDAIQATQSAIEEWITIGWWLALIKANSVIDTHDSKTQEDSIAIDILTSAIKYPILQICKNAGYEGEVVLSKLNDINNQYFNDYDNTIECNEWFNAKTGNYEDLIQSGIIDPVKVIRCSLQNAISTASIFLTTECAILQDKEKNE